ncbi:hypothetical protein KZX46_03065 (plasmid) [Polymorphobacter sp. PAMC 29334]|uniref:hypothetical protein n=1 Tax=Polymorphobacter sp. PAMC 29334 TaxID=2862331 RepID=UPI001C77E0D8|nr:hypothetical protein [Polymorphobacter sp. PAMC 29334]QYE33119.1 hypothetical protein KZX46_03065 [Polymorphobacter sp. PAMC 29334]
MEIANTTRMIDVCDILLKLSVTSARPRYAFLVLTLISEAADAAGRAGPLVVDGNHERLLRDWLSDALSPLVRSERRNLLRQRIIARLAADLPEDPIIAEAIVSAAVDDQVRASSKTNISRAVGDLLRAGLVRRHYAGWRTNHQNRGGRRSAVYTVEAGTLAALRRRSMLI